MSYRDYGDEPARLRDGAPPFSAGARRAYSARFGVAFNAGEWAAAPEDAAGAEKLLPAAYKAIDKAMKRGVIKGNTADRKKSRLAAAIKRAKA